MSKRFVPCQGGEALKQVAQEGDGVTVPRGVQEMSGSGTGGHGLTIQGLNWQCWVDSGTG